jgi:hypothetical protein
LYYFNDFGTLKAYYQKSHLLDVLLSEPRDPKSLPEIMGLRKYVERESAVMKKVTDYNYDYS